MRQSGRNAESFSERVRSTRQRLRTDTGRRWTQGDLAAAVGVERNTVSRWENGGVMPKDPATIARLARTLGVTTDWLIGEPAAIGTPTTAPALRVAEGRGRKGRSGSAIRIAGVMRGYLERLREAGCSEAQLNGAEELMVSAAENTIASEPYTDRAESEIIADVDSAWDVIVRILRREGLRV